MTVKEIMAELEGFGDKRTKQTPLKHSAKEPFFGVKVTGNIGKVKVYI